MAGGYAVLKDITKTTVYELCRYRNTWGRAIPERVMTKPPSAELKPDQKDTDSLPPYDELDPILRGYIEDDLSPEELVAAGHQAGDGRAGHPAGRPQRVQAPAGSARREDHRSGPSGAIAACRSSTGYSPNGGRSQMISAGIIPVDILV